MSRVRAATAVLGAAGLVVAIGLTSGCASASQRAAAPVTGPDPAPTGCSTPSPSAPIASAAATASPAASTGANSGQYPRSFIDAQDRLIAVADPIVELADPSESSDRAKLDPVAEAGFGGISIDVPSSTLHLAWKGPVPADVQRILRSAPKAVHVDLRSAPYSLAELLAGQQAVVDASPRLKSRIGVEVETVSTGTIGQGLDVGYRPTGADPGPAAVLAALRPIVHVPVLTAECTEGVDVSTGLRG